MPYAVATPTTLLDAPAHERLHVTFIGFDSVRERCRRVGVGVGTELMVREATDTHLVLEVGRARPVTLDLLAARFVQVVCATCREHRAA